jgi:outer membrane biosynthesis protein TonB
MASFAHLAREERLGLGIAAVAHVALVAALVWQVNDDPTPLPIPERMDVSLADDVTLEDTSPDPEAALQAAGAPVLSEVPEPVVEPQPEPRPTVRPTTPAPRAAASPRPTPTPTPRSTQTQRGGSNRFEEAFSPGSPNASATGSTQGQPARTFGPAEAASLNSAISRQIKPHWNSPQGVDVELLVTIVRFRLDRDGTLTGRPTCIRQSGETPSNAAQKALHCERAIRAVQLAAPFDLPDEFYDKWKLIDSRFDRRL